MSAYSCPCCGWHLKSNCQVHADVARSYVRRVRRWMAIRDLSRDICIWCLVRGQR
jgi:hypothetical protein